ncbi:MAG: methylmalonyl-CoA mutase subunit beta [Chloroherpetonaceae bacterium]|nr:methylmalonyl-CoA mutase subunit beta [Chloroherpetonaceae bacterium]MDW8437915.1 methylmalonyl-CoA mutase subunit beta [Chloroherpetonaceae bacterium]
MSAKLFAEFPPVKKSEWLAEIARDLKGKPFDETLVWRTLEGFDAQPIYASEDSAPFAIPFKPTGEWLIREEIFERDVKAANRLALDALNRGAMAIAFFAAPQNASDMRALLDGIWLEAAPVHFYSCQDAPRILALFLDEVRSRNLDPKFVHGSIDFDAIAAFATTGKWDAEAFAKAAQMIQTAKSFPHFKVVTIRADVYHNAGGSLSQELAFALATAVEYLDALTERGVSAEEALRQFEVSFAVSASYLLEIAKFRAARWLFGELAKAYGASAMPTIHASSARWNKTIYDAHNNLLRGTIEAMAAATGGADSITVARFDELFKSPNEFSAHLSRNTSLILRDESHLDKVVDPAAGSYALEALTDAMGNAAWSLFQRLESQGGMIPSLRSGFVQAEIRRVREARDKLIAEKKLNVIGVTKSPNAKEKMKGNIEIALESPKPPSDAEIEVLLPYRAVEAVEFERLGSE